MDTFRYSELGRAFAGGVAHSLYQLLVCPGLLEALLRPERVAVRPRPDLRGTVGRRDVVH